MSWLTLIVQLVVALVKSLGLSLNARPFCSLDAALQRNEEMKNEEVRIAASARAGLAVDGMPDPQDPADRAGSL